MKTIPVGGKIQVAVARKILVAVCQLAIQYTFLESETLDVTDTIVVCQIDKMRALRLLRGIFLIE